MATSMQDYSPINSLQKMVDTIPNSNVNSSGSEKKAQKTQKERKHAAAIQSSTITDNSCLCTQRIVERNGV